MYIAIRLDSTLESIAMTMFKQHVTYAQTCALPSKFPRAAIALMAVRTAEMTALAVFRTLSVPMTRTAWMTPVRIMLTNPNTCSPEAE